MNINDVFPSKFLKASDLEGGERNVTISLCAIEDIGQDRKLVIYFREEQKGMICNRTNADRIAHLYSPDTDGWIGKPITLYADMVNFQGRVVEALRVRPPQKRNGNMAVKATPPKPAPKPLARGQAAPVDEEEPPWQDEIPDFGR